MFVSTISVGAISVTGARGQRLAQTGIDQPARAWRQQDAELVLRAAAHRDAGRNAVADHRFHEADRRQNPDLAGRHFGLAGQAPDAAEVIAVIM